jgi:hypothetical protein
MPRRSQTGQTWKDYRSNLSAGLRFALFRPVATRAFCVNLEQLLLLVLTTVTLTFAYDLAKTGFDGMFNRFAIAYAAFTVTLGFAACYLLARWLRRPSRVMTLLVMSTAAAPVFYAVEILLALTGVMNFKSHGWPAVAAYWLLLGWYLLVVFRILSQVLRRTRGQHVLGTVGYAVATVVPLYLVPYQYFWLPDYTEARAPRAQVNAEQVFYAQHDLLEQAKRALLRQRPGVTDLYFVGFGSYAHEDVFMKEVHVIRELFDTRFDTTGRSVALINNPRTTADTPIASATNLERTLRHLGRVMDPEEDVLVLYLTSHGSRQHRLAVDFWPLSLNTLTPERLRQMLDSSGIKWRVVVISACFSGGFIEKLRDEHTLVMTSASAGRESFGCGAASDFTYFGKALFDVELRRTFSFTEAFQAARRQISEREQSERFTPSEPQLAASPIMEQKLTRLARDLGRRRATSSLPRTAAGVRAGRPAKPCGVQDC